MAQVSQTRELLMQMLLSVSQEEHYSHLVLRDTLEKYQFLPKKDRAFISPECLKERLKTGSRSITGSIRYPV